jgi:hypothetical protein
LTQGAEHFPQRIAALWIACELLPSFEKTIGSGPGDAVGADFSTSQKQ